MLPDGDKINNGAVELFVNSKLPVLNGVAREALT